LSKLLLTVAQLTEIVLRLNQGKHYLYFPKFRLFVRILFIFLFICSYSAQAQFYNGSQQEFGKNRVQYYEFDWRYQNYERFKVFFYRGEEEIAEYAAKTIQRELLNMESFLNYSIQEHLEILVFKSLTDLRQSNIGLTNENEAQYGGKSQIVGSKLFIYYQGNHVDLQNQIREVIAETVVRNILFGDQWSDVLIGNDPNKHPTWFTKGFVDYLAQPWDADFEATIKDGFLTGLYDDFSRLDEEQSRHAGHAFWSFIEETYGKSQLMNLLYLTKMSGHIDRSLEYVLGSDLKTLLPSFSNYYKKRFLADLKYEEDIVGTEINFRSKKNEILVRFAASTDGERIAYVLNKDGRYRIFLKQSEEKKAKKIKAYEPKLPRIQDLTFPILAFHPNGDYLVYFIERKGKLMFSLYDIEEGTTTQKELPSLEKVLSADYSKDGQSLVISGVKNGQTDLYTYKISGNSLDQLTDDLWDDLDPKWTLDGENIIFSSNRNSDTLKEKEEILPSYNKLDLFVFDYKKKDRNKIVLKRLTNTPEVNETQPVEVKEDVFYYLNDQNGLRNRWKLEKDSVISFIDTMIHYRFDNKMSPATNFNTSILNSEVISQTEVISQIHQNGKDYLYRQILNEGVKESNKVYFLNRREQKNGPEGNESAVEEKPEPTKDSIPVKIEISEDGRYEKQTLVLYQSTEEYQNQENLLTNNLEYGEPLRVPYKLNFAKDYVSAKIDNSFLSQSYQRYSGPGSVYLNPSVSGFLRISFSDVMEDYVLSGGIRIPTSRNSSEFYAAFDMRKQRLDKQLFYYRRSYEDNRGKELDKLITHEVQLNLNYPFSEVFSWRSTVLSRIDVAQPLAIDKESLLRNTNYFYQGGLKTSLVFDNARQWSENAWSGTKAKVFAEYLQNVESNATGMINLGFDLRHSIKLIKELVWVNRLAAGTSLGNSRLLYYMGGVDNWLLRPKVNFNNDIPVDPKGQFAYQTLATPMRGFIQNQRNGNSFAVFNSELRIPVFMMLSKTTVKNEPLRMFQFITFFDLGTAWTGPHPFSADNFFNIQTIIDKPVVIKIVDSREPIVAATGFGLRSKIFGYFVRGDLGWGIENGSFNKRPQLFLSLSHDI
jgi:WD40 repeat protein